MDTNIIFDTTLHSASECLQLATSLSYVYQIEEETLAYLINSAANTGEKKMIYQSILSDKGLKTLKSNGYEVTYPYKGRVQSLISWA